MTANGSEDPVEVANSADATSPSGKGLEQVRKGGVEGYRCSALVLVTRGVRMKY